MAYILYDISKTAHQTMDRLCLWEYIWNGEEVKDLKFFYTFVPFTFLQLIY